MTSAVWSSFYQNGAAEYEKQSAGVTRKISEQVLTLLPRIKSSSVIHDNACGPGIVTISILAQAMESGIEPPTIFATDYTEGMVTLLKQLIEEKDLKTVTAQVMDGSDLSAFKDNTFTHSITNFGIFMFPDPVAGTRHILRTLKPGSVAAITTWKISGGVTFANEVLQNLAPGSTPWWPMKEWLHVEKLRDVLEQGGFEKEKLEIMEVKTSWGVNDVEETAKLFDGKFWDLAKSGLNEEQKAGWGEAVRRMLKEREGCDMDMVAWVALARK